MTHTIMEPAHVMNSTFEPGQAVHTSTLSASHQISSLSSSATYSQAVYGSAYKAGESPFKVETSRNQSGDEVVSIHINNMPKGCDVREYFAEEGEEISTVTMIV